MKLFYFFSLGVLLSVASLASAEEPMLLHEKNTAQLQEKQPSTESKEQTVSEASEYKASENPKIKPKTLSAKEIASGTMSATIGIASLLAAGLNIKDHRDNPLKFSDAARVYSTALVFLYVGAEAFKNAYTVFTKA